MWRQRLGLHYFQLATAHHSPLFSCSMSELIQLREMRMCFDSSILWYEKGKAKKIEEQFLRHHTDDAYNYHNVMAKLGEGWAVQPATNKQKAHTTGKLNAHHHYHDLVVNGWVDSAQQRTRREQATCCLNYLKEKMSVKLLMCSIAFLCKRKKKHRRHHHPFFFCSCSTLLASIVAYSNLARNVMTSSVENIMSSSQSSTEPACKPTYLWGEKYRVDPSVECELKKLIGWSYIVTNYWSSTRNFQTVNFFFEVAWIPGIHASNFDSNNFAKFWPRAWNIRTVKPLAGEAIIAII